MVSAFDNWWGGAGDYWWLKGDEGYKCCDKFRNDAIGYVIVMCRKDSDTNKVKLCEHGPDNGKCCERGPGNYGRGEKD